MLRNCDILVHTNMLDATHLVQINMPVSFLSNMLDTTPVMGWVGGVNVLRTSTHTSRMLRNCVILVHTNMLDATHLVQINMPVSFLSNMLDTTPVMGWVGDVSVLRTCTHPGCYAIVLFLCTQTCLMPHDNQQQPTTTNNNQQQPTTNNNQQPTTTNNNKHQHQHQQQQQQQRQQHRQG